MSPVSGKPCIDCAVCGERGIWFANAHVQRIGERCQLFPLGASIWPLPHVIVAPVCSAACANEMTMSYDCPIYDKDGVELHAWLKGWREEQKRRRAA